MSEPKYIVVVGASAGGLNSVIELSAQLKEDMDIAMFVVLHLSPNSVADILIERIQKSTPFKCVLAEHDKAIKSGHIYLATPDKHLVLKKDKMILGEGPQENRWRPSIDVLFRSAAAAYDGRVIGIILSGMLQDGTSGMIAIKRCGGTCIVQDPEEAEYPDMPSAVLQNVSVDYCVKLEKMGAILSEKSSGGVYTHHKIPDDVKAEAEIAERAAVGMENVKALGEKSEFSCPDCGGGLWKMVQDDIERYRCYTGHVYNEAELLLKQSESLENTLWVALRMMEERRNLLKKMAEEEERKGWSKSAGHKKEREKEFHHHIERLKEVLFDTKLN